MTTTSIEFAATVPDQDLHNLFVTACEGGIDYWADVVEYRWSNGAGVDDLEGFYAVIVDQQDGVEYVLNAETLRQGLLTCARAARPDKAFPGEDASYVALALLMAGKFPDRDLDVDYDADVADCIAQVALLGEVVYG